MGQVTRPSAPRAEKPTPSPLQRLHASAKRSEKQEQRAIVDLLRAIGAVVYVLGTTRRKGDHPGTMQTPGIPDLYAFLPAKPFSVVLQFRPIWIEVKAVKGILRPAQKGFRWLCEMSGEDHFTGTADQFAAELTRRGYVKGKASRALAADLKGTP
jgi:hypothetical protein